ncbi:MAG TPA: RidA family protein [Dehalococcoidia bacterium]
MSAEDNARDLGLDLAKPATPMANYVPAVRTGNLVYLSGHVPPAAPDGSRPAGKVGADLDIDAAYQLARTVAVAMLASLRAEIGSLDRVTRVVKVLGMVNVTPDFTQHPRVVNGASDLLVEVFGEAIGKHARTAVGVAGLPANVPIEIEMVVEIAD